MKSKTFIASSLAWLCTLATSCGLFDTGTSNLGSGGNRQVLEVTAERSGDTAEGQFLANATEPQQMKGAGALSSAGLILPVGTLNINTTIQITTGAAMNEDGDLAAVGLSSSGIKQQGPAVTFAPADRSVVPANPMTLQIPAALATSLGLLLQEESEGFQAVLYRAIVPGQEGTEFGVIPAQDIQLRDGLVVFDTLYFGSFQAVRTEAKVETRAKVPSAAELPDVEFISEAGQTQKQQADDGDIPADPADLVLSHGLRHGDNASTPEVGVAGIAGAASYLLAVTDSAEWPQETVWHGIPSAGTNSLTGLSLASGRVYYVHGQALGDNGAVLAQGTSSGWQQLACPAGYVKVHGNETPGLGGSVYTHGSKTLYDWDGSNQASVRLISDFCMMKYEARNAGNNTPVSTDPLVKPWVQVTQADARSHCRGVGASYDLMNNNQWQTIARNLENVAANQYGSVFNMGYYQKAAGTAPESIRIAASSNDADGCIHIPSHLDTNNVDDRCNGQWQRFKRTHTLANGEVIWDFAGNVSELLLDRPATKVGNSGHTQGNSWTWIGMTAGLDTMTDAEKLLVGPAGSYDSNSSDPYLGLGTINQYSADSVSENAPGVMERGSSYWWEENQRSGIFSYRLNSSAGRQNLDVGFRCVYAP